MPMLKRPLFTEQFDDFATFRPSANSVYISGRSIEERSEHLSNWASSPSDTAFVRVVEEKPNSVVIKHPNHDAVELALRSNKQVQEFLANCKGATLYLDITGLRHHVWHGRRAL